MEHFHILTDIYFGDRALDRLSEIGCRKAFIVTDPFIVKSDAIRNITRPLQKGGIEYEVFTDVVPDPPVEKVVEGVAAFVQSGSDVIIGIGGGSAMDLSKSIRKMAVSMAEDAEKDIGKNAENGAGTTQASVRHIPLICIPTTSGTGSEVTSFAVISNPATKSKIPLVSDDMTPDEAILDPILVRSVPASVTADTGMDVLTHAIEAYVSTSHNDFSGALAEKAVAIVGQYLFRSYSNNQDTHARSKMHVAATLAGLAFNSASLGLNHGMAHQLGAHFHIPHGRANAMLLPLVIQYNAGVTNMTRDSELLDDSGTVNRYCRMASMLGLAGFNKVMTIHSLCNYIRYMNDEMHIPSRISELFPDLTKEEYESHLDAMAEAALDDSCTVTNPRQPSKPDVIELYRRLW